MIVGLELFVPGVAVMYFNCGLDLNFITAEYVLVILAEASGY